VIKEYHEANTLIELLDTRDKTEQIKALTRSKPVMLFIKGSIDQPACGFTSKLLFKIKDYISAYTKDIGYFNILSDDGVRQGLKEYSEWKT